jgi:hypothetical protein
MGNSYFPSRALGEVQAPSVNKGTSIIYAHLYGTACLRVGYLHSRADRQLRDAAVRSLGL